MSKDEFKISIPKLKKETNYSEWKETVFSVLGTKQLQHFVHFDVQKPVLVNLASSTNTLRNPLLTMMLVSEEMLDVLRRLPRDLLNKINSEERLKIFLEDSDDLPDMLVELAINAEIILILDNVLYSVYTDLEDFRKARTNHVTGVEKTRSLIRSSIAYENVHLFKDRNVFKAFQTVSKQFEKDLKIERQSVKRRLRRLKCKNLKHYVNDFRKLLVELDHAQGERDCEEIVSIFLNNIPNSKYMTYKTLFKGNSIDEAFEWFQHVWDKQENLREGETNVHNENVKVRQTATKDGHSESTKANVPTQTIQIRKVSIAKRCMKCGGFGHLLKDCPNEVPVCHRCGSPSHFKKECKVRKIFVENVQSDEESIVVDDTEDFSGDDGLSLSDVHVRTIFIRRLEAETTCSCRFKENCLQLILDSGASQSITGNKQLLTNLKKIPAVQVTNAFGTESKSTLQGDIKCMLNNNVILEIKDVLFCSSVDGTLVSVQQLVTQGFNVSMDVAGARLLKEERELYKTTYANGSYTIHATTKFKQNEIVKAYKTTSMEANLHHARFGHASLPYLKRLGLDASANNIALLVQKAN